MRPAMAGTGARRRHAPPLAFRPGDHAVAAIMQREDAKGWSRAGGSQITAKEGETVYNLSRRFGVPADVIMKANGLNKLAGLQAGQKIVIPTYVYSDKAGVSAPDNDPKVAEAKSSRGTKSDVPANKAPTGAPGEKVASVAAAAEGQASRGDHRPSTAAAPIPSPPVAGHL